MIYYVEDYLYRNEEDYIYQVERCGSGEFGMITTLEELEMWCFVNDENFESMRKEYGEEL